MPFGLLPFGTVIDRLAQLYGEPAPPAVTDPFAMILWENIAYLANDTKRAQAFTELRNKVGLTPKDIRKARDESAARHRRQRDRPGDDGGEVAACG